MNFIMRLLPIHKYQYTGLLMIMLYMCVFKSYSQVTIVNYNFNSGTSYATLVPTLATNITSSISSTETFSTSTGVATGVSAFTANTTAGTALTMTNSTGSNTRYYQFQLGGSALASYATYKIYLQAKRAATPASTLTIAYSTDGTTYTNFATTQITGTASTYNECLFDLSTITAINYKSAVYFRVLTATTSTVVTALAIDNFEVRATACTTPTLTITPSTQTICAGATATLTASGASTYSWTGISTSTVITVTPTTTTVYTLTGNNGSCSSTKTATITVIPAATLNIAPVTATLCKGTSTIITTSGNCTTYTWSTGANTSSISVTPTTTTVYTITGTATNTCKATQSSTITMVTTPTLTITPSTQTICAGATATLTGSGASTYSWTGISTSTVITVNPTSTTIYTLTGYNGICSSIKTATVTVNAIPILTITPSTQTICAGSSATITTSGATSYSLNGISSTSVSVITPISTNVYSVTGTNASGCTSTQTTTITVIASPILTITPSTQTICAGASVILTGSGANTYSWTGISTSTVITVTPTTSTVYTLTGNNGFCSSIKTVSITVNATPILTVTPITQTLCGVSSATITASGATNYSVNNVSSPAIIVVSPTVNATYVVVGSIGLCTSSVVCTVAVCVSTANCTYSVSQVDNNNYTINAGEKLCIGTNGVATGVITLNGGTINNSGLIAPISFVTHSGLIENQGKIQYNGSIYLENTTVLNNYGGVELSGQLLIAKTAAYYGMNATSYFIMGNQTITNLVVTPTTQTICAGNSATFIASGATSYSLNGVASSAVMVVNPTTNTTYTITGINSTGGISTVYSNITVNDAPNLTVTPGRQFVCAGQIPIPVIASGATSYSWSNGSTSNTLTLTDPITATTIYTVTGSNGTCSRSTIVHFTLMTPNIFVSSSSQIVSPGSPVILTASGGATYVWNTGATGAVITVNPTEATTYTVTGTNGICSATATITIGILCSSSNAVSILPSSTAICAGASVTLTAVGASSYLWSNGSTANYIVVNPNTSTTYGVVGINTSGSTNVTQLITVNPNPVVTISAPSTIINCVSGSVLLSSTVNQTPATAYVYDWKKDGVSQNITTANNTVTQAGNYSLRVTNTNNCFGTSNTLIMTSSGPKVNAGSDQLLTAGGPVTLNASITGGVSPYSYSWSPPASFSGNANAQNPTVTVNATTTFSVTVTDAQNCTSTDDMTTLLLKGQNYGVVKKTLDGGYYQVPTNNNVYFKFEEEYAGTMLSYKVYSYDVSSSTSTTPIQIIACSSLASANTSLGINQFSIDLSTCGFTFVTNNYYVLEVTNSKKEKFYLKIKK